MYNKKVISHFRKPKNYGKMEKPDGIGKVGNIVCGDVMWVYIQIGVNANKEEFIKDITFETFGCVAAIATSSIITELAKGKTLKDALNISRDDIVNSLGGLPPVKIHCSVLASDALAEAIYYFFVKKGRPIPSDLQKRHEHLERDRKFVEKKYKNWVGFEEKMENDK